MPPTLHDALIFCTGATGRALGSGKFAISDIQDLTAAAFAAFTTVFGEIQTEPAPSAPSPFTASEVAAVPFAANSTATSVGEADGKPYHVWMGDKIGFGKKTTKLGKTQAELSWSEARTLALEGDKETKGFVEWIATKTNDPQSQYAKKNAVQQARARAILNSLGG